MAYRQKKNSDIWHWCKNCTNYPTSNYEERTSKPHRGDLCTQCLSKEKKKICQK